MSSRGEIAGTAMIAVVLVAFASYLMQPAPIPAVAGVAGGLVAFWLGRERRLAASVAGCLMGALVGMAYHLYSHYSEGRMSEASEGIIRHLVSDWLLGIIVAIVVLTLTFVTFRAILQRSGA